MGGFLVSMQGIPSILTCGNHGTIPESYVAVIGDCEVEKEEKDQHQGLIHPYLFQKFFAQEKETVQCSEERKKLVHSYIQSISDQDVSHQI